MKTWSRRSRLHTAAPLEGQGHSGAADRGPEQGCWPDAARHLLRVNLASLTKSAHTVALKFPAGNPSIQKMKIMASGPITSWEIDGETVETVADFIFWAPKSLQVVTAAMKLKDAYSLEGKL